MGKWIIEINESTEEMIKRASRDMRLSWRAKGVYGYILTVEQGKDERVDVSDIRSSIKELLKTGYIKEAE